MWNILRHAEFINDMQRKIIPGYLQRDSSLKMADVWDIASCSLVEVDRHFRREHL
jgi:hypothetical protein